jgi:hypothetical protein
MSSTTTRTETKQRVLTKEHVETAITKGVFSLEEELVMRMEFGVTLAPQAPLSFRGEGNEELRVKLAMMERSIMDDLEADGDPKDLLSRI